MGSIQKLPDHVINQIKAGEVVDRPVSVVKELVENAIDAGGKNIVVDLIDGGKQLIRVSDDGKGMDESDLLGCLERHATSKLRTLADLDSIASLGFRGEAIPSIASVCRFSVRSRQVHATLGNEIEVENGVQVAVQQVAMPQGTIVSVRELFLNVPVRQKFLKATATEFSHIHDFLFATGLAYPEVGLKLTHNGRDVFSWKPHKDFESRFKTALGADSAEFTKVAYCRGSFRMSGFAGLPAQARPMAKYFITFVNGRMVRDRVIRAGVLQAYSGLVMKGMLPSAVVFITVDPSWIDVNVHPSKTELRFRDSAAVQDLVALAIQDNVKASLAQESAPKPMVQNFASVKPVFAGNCSSEKADTAGNFVPPKGSFAVGNFSSPKPHSQGFPQQSFDTPRFPRLASLSRSQSEMPAEPVAAVEAVVSSVSVAFVEPIAVVQPIVNDSFESSGGPFAKASFLGQFKNCYLLLESNSELWIIDQHAFHERILFEEFVSAAKKEGRVPQQELITPVLVPVPSGVGEVVAQEQQRWQDLGFRVETMSTNSVAIHAFPVLISPNRIVPLFEEILARMVAILGISTSDVHPLLLRARELKPEMAALGLHSSSLSHESVYHLLYATMACHAAVRAGEPLNSELVRRLLLRAKDVDFYAHCPHGRPVWRKFTEADVALWFARV